MFSYYVLLNKYVISVFALMSLQVYSSFDFRDVTYFSSSGSIIAVAGYSSNGVNVVIWDTLAPPATSRASILCHEGFSLHLFVIEILY